MLPVWQNGKPHQNYALEVMWDSWQARAALATTEAPMTDAIAPTEGARPYLSFVPCTCSTDDQRKFCMKKRECTRIEAQSAAPSPEAPAPSVEQPLSDEQITALTYVIAMTKAVPGWDGNAVETLLPLLADRGSEGK